MPTAFVAVIRTGNLPADAVPGLLAAGATAVLTLDALDTAQEPDETIAVLIDVPFATALPARMAAVAGDLDALEGTPAALPTAVVAGVGPVTDTLKLVGADGALVGTADREGHRFVIPPVALRLGLLRGAVTGAAPGAPVGALTLGGVLSGLSARGATVLAARGAG